MEALQAILILVFLMVPLVGIFLLFQSFIALMNSDDFKASEHSTLFEIEVILEKKVRKTEISALSFSALGSPATLPLFFMWPKNEEYAAIFEGKIAVSVRREDFYDLQENQKYKLTKIVTRSFYQRKWYEQPIIFNWVLKHEDKIKNEYEETTVKYKINKQ